MWIITCWWPQCLLCQVTFISGSLSFLSLFSCAGHCKHFSDSYAVKSKLRPLQYSFLIIVTFQNGLSPYTSSVADCNIIPLAFIQNFVLACHVKKSTNYPCWDVSQIFACVCYVWVCRMLLFWFHITFSNSTNSK